MNKYGVKCGTSFRFWENKGWINKEDPYGWFQWYFRYYLGRKSEDDKRQIMGWKRIVNRFRGKLSKLVKKPIVGLMIIIFHLKLDRFYYIGVMN